MVVFVGAGPGAPDLITLRGKEMLERADVIIYAGSLVNPALLDWAKPGCEIHDSAPMTLEQVLEVMLPAAKAGRLVVRLHTGDPSLYGAIREQIDHVEAAGLECEVVPGVSAFSAAAAALRAEYTLPGVSQSLIITRAEGRTPVPEKEEIALLAAHGASMAVYLSTGLLDKLSGRLIAGGYAPDAPAAIVYKASWPEERIVRTTVEKLQRAARDARITKTALILVGGFLGNEYDRSLLYDPGFTHEFRNGTDSRNGNGG